MAEMLGGREWEYVREGFDPAGVHGFTGFLLKRYHIIRDVDTGDEIIVGKGEMETYAGVQAPSASKRKARSATFESAFD